TVRSHESTKPRNTALFRELVLGLVLGVGLRLLLDSALLAVLGKAVLVYFPFSLLWLVVAGVVLGVAAATANLLPEKSWSAIGLTTVLLWPLAAAGPVALMKVRLYELAAT